MEVGINNSSEEPLQPTNQPTDLPTNSEGFDEDFVDPPFPSYECPLCQYILKDAVQLACGHRYCQLCFQKYMQYNAQ